MANNLGLPENLYSGGQGIFNSTPATNFYLQNQARKRARDEALTKYYADFTKSINPAGMRNQDIDGLMQKVNDMKKFYMQNAELIKNPTRDNGKAYSEYMSRYQDLLNYSTHSKNEAEAKKPFVSLLTKPEVRSRLGQNGFDYVHQTDLPINDPNHVDFDMSHPSLDFSGKPITLDDQTRYLNSIATRIKPGKLYQGVETKNGQVIRTYKSTYEPNDVNAVISTSKAAVRDQKWDELADSLHSDFNLYDDLNEKFNAVTGRHIQDNGDIIAAWTLASMNPENTNQTAHNVPRPSNFFFGNGGQQSFNPKTTPVAFDRIGENPLTSSNINIDNGKVTTKDGNPYTGISSTKTENLPAGVLKLVKPYLTKEQSYTDYYDLDIRNGQIQAIRAGADAPWITRQDMYNAELKDNSEPSKQKEQPNYSNQNSGLQPPKAKLKKQTAKEADIN